MIARIVDATMEISRAPRMPRARSTPATARPTTNTSVCQLTRSPVMIDTRESPLDADRTMPASCRPMIAMNAPMPAPIPRRRPSGNACMIFSRRPTITRIAIIRPSTTITPIASSHERPRAPTRPNATKALMPRPAARANGTFAKMPIAMVATAAASAVTVSSAGTCSCTPVLSLSAPRTDGFTNRMYAIVAKVTSPAMISVRTVDPRSVILKWRSRKPPGGW